MAKVQFNCRLDEEVAEWIATEAALKSAELGRKVSQADVIQLLVQPYLGGRLEAVPVKTSKRESTVIERQRSDVFAQIVGP